jgi:hypothetical protein
MGIEGALPVAPLLRRAIPCHSTGVEYTGPVEDVEQV